MRTAPVPAPRDQSVESSRRGVWWLVAMAGTVAICLGLAIGYLQFASTSDETRAGRADWSAQEIDRVVALIDDYEAAWNAHDADRIRALLTDGFLIEGYTDAGTSTQLDYLLYEFFETNARLEYLGQPLVVANESTGSGGYDVSALWLQTSQDPQEPDRYEIISYRVVEEDGTLKIHRANPSSAWFRY